MYPRHWYHHRPSRAFWFIIGAASATLWIKRREHCRSLEHGHCIRQRPTGLATPPRSVGRNELTSILNGEPVVSGQQLEDQRSDRWSFGERRQLERWEEEKEKLMDFALRATDAMTEMSESTLDTVLETMERLKAKIIEHRMKREKQRKQFNQQLEDEKKRSSHLV